MPSGHDFHVDNPLHENPEGFVILQISAALALYMYSKLLELVVSKLNTILTIR